MLTVPTKQQKNQQGEFSIKTQRKEEGFGEGEMTTARRAEQGLGGPCRLEQRAQGGKEQ